MTKIQTYISNIATIIEQRGVLLGAIEQATLRETQTFLSSLELLMGMTQPIIGLQEAVAASEQLPLMSHAYSNHSVLDGLATLPQVLPTPLQTSAPAVLAPIPTAGQPVAIKLSSLTTPMVDGCIAAMPQEVKQSAAQAQLNQMLASKAATPSLEETLRKQMESSTADKLAAQLASQIQAAAAVPLPSTPIIAQGALVQPTYVPNVPVVAEQMKLEDLVAAAAAKEQAEQQAIFDAVLKQQVTGTIRMTPEGAVITGGSIEVSSPVPLSQMNTETVLPSINSYAQVTQDFSDSYAPNSSQSEE